MYDRARFAVSEVLALILVFTIVTSAVSFIIFWGVPYMETKKAEIRRESAKTQFIMINDVIKDNVVSQGFNSSAVASFTTDAGQVSINSSDERFIFYYSLNESFDFNITGLDENPCIKITIKVFPEDGPMADGTADIFYLGTGATSQVDWNPIDDRSGYFDTPVLSDAIKIDIKNAAGDIMGRIWLFDVGDISYDTASPSGVYKVITENGGVVSGKDDNGYLCDEPNIKINDSGLLMRVIQFKSGAATGGSGGGKYQFTVKSNYSGVRENRAPVYGHFKMQIYGAPAAVMAWENFFKLEHGFGKYEEGYAEGTLYLGTVRVFSLIHSLCDVDLEVGII